MRIWIALAVVIGLVAPAAAQGLPVTGSLDRFMKESASQQSQKDLQQIVVRKRTRGGQHMGDEWAAGQRMQHLRQRRMHALALPGGEDRDVERGGHRRVRNDTPPACTGRRRMLQSRGSRPAHRGFAPARIPYQGGNA